VTAQNSISSPASSLRKPEVEPLRNPLHALFLGISLIRIVDIPADKSATSSSSHWVNIPSQSKAMLNTLEQLDLILLLLLLHDLYRAVSELAQCTVD
jgi:hypothetical protein